MSAVVRLSKAELWAIDSARRRVSSAESRSPRLIATSPTLFRVLTTSRLPGASFSLIARARR